MHYRGPPAGTNCTVGPHVRRLVQKHTLLWRKNVTTTFTVGIPCTGDTLVETVGTPSRRVTELSNKALSDESIHKHTIGYGHNYYNNNLLDHPHTLMQMDVIL